MFCIGFRPQYQEDAQLFKEDLLSDFNWDHWALERDGLLDRIYIYIYRFHCIYWDPNPRIHKRVVLQSNNLILLGFRR